MLKLIKTLIIYLLVVVISAYILEYFFTQSYYFPKNPRSKISWILSLNSQDTLDYALFGSSRCIHTVDPTIINSESGTNGLNLAYAASNPLEVKLTLKTLLKKKFVKRIFIQVDYSYNQEIPHPLAEISWMPFIKDEYVYKEFENYDSKYKYFRYIPFYRYMKYDSKIGIRELILNYTKRSAVSNNYGYDPLDGVMKKFKTNTSKPKEKINSHIDEIIEICRQKNIKVDFFTAPIYSFDGDHSALNKLLPNYKDFTNAFTDSGKFQDNTHINDKGAKAFTKLFMKHYFSNDP